METQNKIHNGWYLLGELTPLLFIKKYMLKIDKKTRDQIIAFLQVQVVSAPTGAGLMQVCEILKGLEEIKETPKVAEEVKKWL